MILDHLMSQINIWVVLSIVCGLGAIFIAIYVPPLRSMMLTIGGAILAAGAFYAKGAKDQREAEKRKRDAMVKRLQKKYKDIDEKPVSPDDVQRRMKDGSF